MPRLHVFLGTKAQYIKTAPLLRRLDADGVDYRLIDSGQHARLSTALRADLGVREPDVRLGGADDVTSIAGAVVWAARIAGRLASPQRVRDDLFGGDGGICVVHGDTPSTLLSALLARRAGLRVAHLEAGLRSRSLLHPFPEELIRLAVMRCSDLLFAPDETAVRNLRGMRLRGRIVPVAGNTVVEALEHSLGAAGGGVGAGGGAAVVTMHRVENLKNRRRVDGFIALVRRLAATMPVCFVVHGPTDETLRRSGADAQLRAAGVTLSPLLAHPEFTALLAAAPLVVTDGGSIQEECALLGV
ncbi:MAG: UDP-N-acetylglucosamine 2-epimerase, partial [Actinomycetota bacterium]|nr:UDP-N-acetylglucosamine 2-epimerase [Actinomycetota bacterium]